MKDLWLYREIGSGKAGSCGVYVRFIASALAKVAGSWSRKVRGATNVGLASNDGVAGAMAEVRSWREDEFIYIRYTGHSVDLIPLII